MESMSWPDWRLFVHQVQGGFGRTSHFANDEAIKFKLAGAYEASFVQSWGRGGSVRACIFSYFVEILHILQTYSKGFFSPSLTANISSSSLVRHVPLVSRGAWKQQEAAPPAQRGHRGLGVGYCQEWDPLSAADHSPGQSADAPLPRQARQVRSAECVQHLCDVPVWSVQQKKRWLELQSTPEGILVLLCTSATVRLSFPAQQNRQETQVLAGTQGCDDMKMLS